MEGSAALDLSGRRFDIRSLGDDNRQDRLGGYLLLAADGSVAVADRSRQNKDEQSLG